MVYWNCFKFINVFLIPTKKYSPFLGVLLISCGHAFLHPCFGHFGFSSFSNSLLAQWKWSLVPHDGQVWPYKGRTKMYTNNIWWKNYRIASCISIALELQSTDGHDQMWWLLHRSSKPIKSKKSTCTRMIYWSTFRQSFLQMLHFSTSSW